MKLHEMEHEIPKQIGMRLHHLYITLQYPVSLKFAFSRSLDPTNPKQHPNRAGCFSSINNL